MLGDKMPISILCLVGVCVNEFSQARMSKKQSKGSSVQFFWDRKANSNRSRFNLLLLEYGEYLLEDLSAYYFPIPTNDLSTAFEVKDSLKVQGRLKLSTRSLMFEPAEAVYPIYRFPYKFMQGKAEEFHLKEIERRGMSVDVSGYFTFCVQSSLEMKENNKVGPYKQIDYSSAGGHRSVIALVHADLPQFLAKLEQLRHIFNVSVRQGVGAGTQLLKPFIESAQLWTLQFDTSHLVNFHEKLLFDRPLAAKKVKPLIVNPGSLMLTDARVYFQPSQLNNTGDSVLHFDVRSIARVFPRRYLLQQTGLEFILTDSTSHLFVLDSQSLRDMAYGLLLNLRALSASARGDPAPSNSAVGHSVSASASREARLDALCRRWQRRELTNFEYLMALNSEADRSVNDLTQYPVFPHILADFTSKKLNLDEPTTFRDLSKPIGALNPERLQYFKQRMASMPPEDPALGLPPPFLYGTHYSTPGYVLHYLVRVAPEYMLCLQNGKFDAPDRMFHNIDSTWQSCLHNPTDLKELIPEFFTGSGEFLLNLDDLDLGHLHTGERLNDVTLPPWADSPRDFIRKHTKALESEHVSEHLHEWIDLIFGYKQQGPAAREADNLYYYLTYEGAVDLDTVKDSRERDALILQIQEFGQTPKQLFRTPHPCRNSKPPQSPPREKGAHLRTVSPPNAPEETKAVRKSPVPPQASSASPRSSREPSREVGAAEAQQLSALLSGTGSSSTVSPVPAGATAAEPDGEEGDAVPGVKLLHLDEEFRREVERELQSSTSTGSAKVAGTTPGRGEDRARGDPSAPVAPPATSPSQSAKTLRGITSSIGVTRERKPAETLYNTVLSWTFGSPNTQRQQQQQPQQAQVGGLQGRGAESRVPSPPPPPAPSSSPVGARSIKDKGKEVNPTALSLRYLPDPRKLVMLGSEPFYWHSKAVTSVAAVLYPESPMVSAPVAAGRTPSQRFGSAAVTEVTHALVASVARDANLKVTRVEQVVTGEFVREGGSRGVVNGESRYSLHVSVAQTNVSPRRTNSVSASSLSAVVLLADLNHVLFASWDNNIYGYSVSHAHTVSKTYAHDDAVTCMSLCKRGRLLLTGSLDATAKLWEVRDPSDAGDVGASLISSAPAAVFPDLDSPVTCVAVDGSGRLGAAGSEDGTLAVWDLSAKGLLCAVPTNASNRPVRCLHWVQETVAPPSLLCGTEDGWLLRFTASGQQVGAVRLERSGVTSAKAPAAGRPQQGDVHVRCLQSDGDFVYGGCSDGSLRCWLLSEGALEEVYRHGDAHSGPVTALQIAGSATNSSEVETDLEAHGGRYSAVRHTKLMLTASEDCAVRVWRVFCSGDY